MAERDDPIIGRTVAGKFVVEEFLGGGAMGSVYRARQTALDKRVAIKILHHEMAAEPAFVVRFHREALAASKLDHPSSVRVLDFGEDDGLLYIVMEYLAGRDLLTVMNEEWPLDSARIALILSQVLAALAVAHELGIVHRDLKPENIMVMPGCTDDGVPMDVVKVCDFGIATIAGAVEEDPTAPRLTAKGLVMGTPDYMSPEQARGERLDHRTDLYSVGVILYHLLTGRTPFEAESALGIALKHVTEPVTPPSAMSDDVHPVLERICLRAMEKKREERYESARAMRADLRVVLEEAGASLPPIPSSRTGTHLLSRPQGTIGFEKRSNTVGYEQPLPDSRRPKPTPRPEARIRSGSRARTLAMVEPDRRDAVTLAAPAIEAPKVAVESDSPVARSSPPKPFEQLSSNEIQVMVDERSAAQPPPRRRGGLVVSVLLLASAVAGAALFVRSKKPQTPAPTAVQPPPLVVEPARAVVTTPIAETPAPVVPVVASSPSASTSAAATHVAAKPKWFAPTKTGQSKPAVEEAVAPPPPEPVPAPTPAPVIASAPPPAPAPPPVVTVTAAPKPVFDPNTASVSISALTATNGLNGSNVRNALSHVPFARCYHDALVAKGAPASGSATLMLSISESGYVTSATLSAPFLPTVRACIESAAKSVKVKDVDTGEATATVTLSFTHK